MKYDKRVIALLASQPWRAYKAREIVRFIAPDAGNSPAVRSGIRRTLDRLMACGAVHRIDKPGRHPRYRWGRNADR